jgi:hypothetical protein
LEKLSSHPTRIHRSTREAAPKREKIEKTLDDNEKLPPLSKTELRKSNRAHSHDIKIQLGNYKSYLYTCARIVTDAKEVPTRGSTEEQDQLANVQNAGKAQTVCYLRDFALH